MKCLLFFPACLFLISCATSPQKPLSGEPLTKAKWETKAVVRDLKANKSHSLDIDVLGDYPDRFRLEVSALMGVQVASLALNKDEVRYALYHQKKFFQGKASEASFLPLMSIPLHPVNFMAIAYDKPLRGPGWHCKKGADNQIAECAQATQNIKVVWSDRTPEGQKKVVINGPSFEMRWLFRPPQTEVQFKDETFQLEAPADFKTISLR